MNIDIGGQKHRRDMNRKWTIVDITDNCDIKINLNSGKERVLDYFVDNIVDNIYCSHTLEHIEPTNIIPLLKEFYRILKPGGKCRIVVPDTAFAINLYLNNPKELENKKYCSKPKETPNTPMARLSAWFYTGDKGNRNGHRMGFDKQLLVAFITSAGFKNYNCMSYNKCSEIFVGKDYERYEGWSLYYEIQK